MRFLIPVAALAACSNSPTSGATAWQDALDRAQISLRDSVQVAEGDGATAKQATLRTDGGGVFSVTALANQAYDDVRVDALSGTIVSKQPIAYSADECAGAISLADAISAAEKQVGGEAVQAAPDDDGHCNTEVIVLSGDKLWEVKIGPKGELVEDPEEADSNEGPDGTEG
jgi:uncharacterized membrane protein YkoI